MNVYFLEPWSRSLAGGVIGLARPLVTSPAPFDHPLGVPSGPPVAAPAPPQAPAQVLITVPRDSAVRRVRQWSRINSKPSLPAPRSGLFRNLTSHVPFPRSRNPSHDIINSQTYHGHWPSSSYHFSPSSPFPSFPPAFRMPLPPKNWPSAPASASSLLPSFLLSFGPLVNCALFII